MATSRGAGAAQRGYDYKVYKKGGKVRKYADGGGIDRTHETRAMRFSDLFGSKKPADAMDETNMRAARETETAREASLKSEDRETSRPGPGAAKESLPTAPQRRMRRRQAAPAAQRYVPASRAEDPEAFVRESRERQARESQAMGIGDDPILARERRARASQAAMGIYAKGGAVKKYASGGSVCRGMGAATKGGKYKIK